MNECQAATSEEKMEQCFDAIKEELGYEHVAILGAWDIGRDDGKIMSNSALFGDIPLGWVFEIVCYCLGKRVQTKQNAPEAFVDLILMAKKAFAQGVDANE